MADLPNRLRYLVGLSDALPDVFGSNWRSIAEAMESAAVEIERLQSELKVHADRRAESDAAWAVSDARIPRI